MAGGGDRAHVGAGATHRAAPRRAHRVLVTVPRANSQRSPCPRRQAKIALPDVVNMPFMTASMQVATRARSSTCTRGSQPLRVEQGDFVRTVAEHVRAGRRQRQLCRLRLPQPLTMAETAPAVDPSQAELPPARLRYGAVGASGGGLVMRNAPGLAVHCCACQRRCCAQVRRPGGRAQAGSRNRCHRGRRR